MDLHQKYSTTPTNLDHEGHPCPSCKGRKVIKNHKWWDNEDRTIKCTTCDGCGWVYSKVVVEHAG